MNLKNKPFWITMFLTLLGILTGALVFTNLVQLQEITELVRNSGQWGYFIFIAAYVTATLLVLPSTAFNVAGGAIFGGFQGLLITSIAALTSATIAFAIARTLGKDYRENHISKQWGSLNEHLKVGGFPYALAMRFFPLVPYSVVSFAAGFSQINKRDYFLGTLLGTPLGLAPFVWLGHSGMQAANGYSILPLTITGGVLAALVMAGTWYQQTQRLKDVNYREMESLEAGQTIPIPVNEVNIEKVLELR